MDTFTPLEKTLLAMSQGLSPAQRKKMATKAAQRLRKANSDRIKANIDPDGNAFEPRKPQRTKKGRIRRKAKMFKKLREFRHLKVRATEDSFEVGFNARDSRLALVHHEGRWDYINKAKSKRRIRYPERRLLGITSTEEETLLDDILHAL